jgi:hypothetical protein
MKRFFLRLALIAGLLVAIPPAPTATAIDYIRLTGTVNSQGTITITVSLQDQYLIDSAIVYSGGSYSMVVPKNTPLEIMVSSNNASGFSSWRRSTTFNEDSILNFNVPPGIIKVSGRVVDAQGNPLRNALVRMGSGSMVDFQISSDGTFWTGSGQSQSMKSDAAGNFALYSYPTGSKVTLTVREDYSEKDWISPKFTLDGPIEFIVCFPINFGASLSLPTYCSHDLLTQAAATAAEANRKEQGIWASPLITGSVSISSTGLFTQVKSTSNLPVFAYNNTKYVCEYENGMIQTKTTGRCVIAFSQEGNSEFKPASNLILDFTIESSASKKITITCVKGKITKKVTAVKPKCPTGYKVKK